MTNPIWTHLHDPSDDELDRLTPPDLHEIAHKRLRHPRDFAEEVFPRLESHDHYLFGELAYPVYDTRIDEVGTIGIRVVIDFDHFLTVTRTPNGLPNAIDLPDLTGDRQTSESLDLGPGDCIWLLTVNIAEKIHLLLDKAHDRTDQIEVLLNHDDRSEFSATSTRQEISRLRNIFLQLGTITSPTLTLAEKIIDDELDLKEEDGDKTRELFPRYTEIRLIDVRESLRHAVQRSDYGRDMMNTLSDNLSDYLNREQARAGNRLTAIASIMLLPTFIVGLYGMNIDKNYFPEFGWLNGYLLAWLVIGLITAVQILVFRKMGWLFRKRRPRESTQPTA